MTIPADVKVYFLEGQVTLETSWRTSLMYLAGLNFIFILSGRSGRHRTRNLRFWRPALYQLSYTPSLTIAADDYSIISETTPDPTVLPPSRIANLKLLSIAIGESSSTVSVTLSPGITISVPSGKVIDPVTSVVLK